MIIIYTQKLDNAIKLSLALGGISHRGKVIREITPSLLSEITEDAGRNFYIRTSIGTDPAVFTWGDDMIVPYKISDYGSSNIESGFITDNIKFKPREERLSHLEVVSSIFKNDSHGMIYDASIGSEARMSFYCLYSYTGVKKDVRKVNLESLEPEDIRRAFLNPMPITSTFRKMLRDSSYVYIYYIANLNLPLILSKACPPPFPKLRELPVLKSITARDDMIRKELEGNYYQVYLVARRKSGEEFTLKSKDAKFKFIADAEHFASRLPKVMPACLAVKTIEEYPAGPHSVGSIEKEAETRFKYKRMKTDLILSALYQDGFITTASTSARTYPEGSDADISRLITGLAKTNIFSDLDVSEFTIPDRFFANDRKSGILTTRKKPDKSFAEPERRNIYYLISKEMMKTVLGPRILKKKIVTLEFDNIKFTASGTEVTEPGYSVLDEKYVACALPEGLSDKESLDISYIIEGKVKSLPAHKTEEDIFREFSSFLSTDDARIMLDSLVRRGLLERKGKALILGSNAASLMHFIEKLDDMAATPLAWEDELNAIKSEKTLVETSEHLARNLKEDARVRVRKWHVLASEIAGKETLITCPGCGENLYSTSKELYCKACGLSLARTQYGRALSDEDFACLIRFGTTPLLDGFYPEGKKLTGRIYLDAGKKVQFTEDSTFKCPSCGEYLRKDGDKYVCKGCQFTLRRKAFSHSFRRDEFSRLLSDGRTGVIDELIDKYGEIFEGVIYLDPEDSYRLKAIRLV